MKTKEELNAIKEEVENLNKELRELTEEELAQVTGGQGTIVQLADSIATTVTLFPPNSEELSANKA